MTARFLELGKFKDAVATVQGIAVATAIVVGGLWTLAVFGTRDLPKLERELREQANVQFEFDVTPLPTTGAGGQVVSVRVEAQNLGNRAAVLDFHEPALRVRALHNEGDCIRFGAPMKAKPLSYVANPESERFPRSRLRASGSQSYFFVVHLPRAGAYWITMSVPVAKEDSAEWPEHAGHPVTLPARSGTVMARCRQERSQALKGPGEDVDDAEGGAKIEAGKQDALPAAKAGRMRHWSGGTVYVVK